jgi:hypothetical protein
MRCRDGKRGRFPYSPKSDACPRLRREVEAEAKAQVERRSGITSRQVLANR